LNIGFFPLKTMEFFMRWSFAWLWPLLSSHHGTQTRALSVTFV
jgi:hypothetical protein